MISNFNNNKINYRKIGKYISVILVIIWMGIVFWFSAQNGQQSKAQSGSTIKKIVSIQNPESNNNIKKQNDIIESLQPVVRKMAHFTLYTLGGFLILNLMNNFKIGKLYKIMFSIGIGVVYAITDEIHQSFVPQRCGRIFDVFVDSCGVITGIILFIFIAKIIKCLMKNKKEKKYGE